MKTMPQRRVLAALLTSLLTVAALALGIAPAQAAVSGDLQGKGVGSYYSQFCCLHRSVAAGSTTSFSAKVVNTGSVTNQFKVVASAYYAGQPYTVSLYKGSTLLPSGKYWTEPLAPGKSVVLTVKVSVASGAPPTTTYPASVSLFDADTGSFLDSMYFNANVATAPSGSSSYEIFLKQGSQLWVGGSVAQYMGAPAVAVGGSGTFVARLRNDGPVATQIGLHVSNPTCTGFTVTVKLGTTDITSAALSGSYISPVLSSGAYKDYKVILKYAAAGPCSGAYVTVGARQPGASYDQTVEYAMLPIRA